MGVESVRIALSGLIANKLRSGLTMLGLMIGVASVIILIAVGNGSSHAVQARIRSLGTNVLLVLSQNGLRGSRTANRGVSPLTSQDAAALVDPIGAPDVLGAAPVVNLASASLVAGGVSYSPSQFVGTTPTYLLAHDYSVASGRTLTAADVSGHANVAVVGPTVAQDLFPGADPVGQTVRVNGVDFQIVGETQPKGSNGSLDQDDIVVAPITAVQDSLTGFGPINSITVQATSESGLANAQAEVTAILERRHGATAASPGFSVINQGSLLQTSSSTTGVFTTLLGEVAAISLLVGGIGVMNIMLVSVTERTREIGIRKAIGARRGDILAQFLIEAVLVSVFGGLAGVVLGIVGSQFTIAGVHPIVAPYSVFLGFGAAVVSGLFFGTYPASRAAALRPIQALRYE